MAGGAVGVGVSEGADLDLIDDGEDFGGDAAGQRTENRARSPWTRRPTHRLAVVFGGSWSAWKAATRVAA